MTHNAWWVGRSVRAVTRNPRLLRVQAAYAIATVVELGIWVTTLFWAYDRSGPTLVGAVAFASLVPAAVLAPFGGAVGDRMARDRALLVAYLTQAVAMAALALAMAAGPPTAVVVVLSITVTVAISWTRPSHYSAALELAETPGEAAAANSLSGTFEGLGYFLGPLLAGIVTGAFGVAWSAAVLAVLTLVAGVLTRRLGLARPPSQGGVDAARGPGVVVRALVRRPSVGVVLLLVGVGFLLEGCWEVLGVAYVAEHLQGGPGEAGLLIGSLGVGGLGGSALAMVLIRWGHLSGAVVLGLGAAGLPLLVMPALHEIGAAVVVGMVAGVGLRFFSVSGVTALQRGVEVPLMARILGLRESALLGGTAVGALVAPLLLDVFGSGGAYAALGVALSVAAVASLPVLLVLDARQRFRPEVVELMRSVPFLGVLDVAALEGLAQSAAEVDVGVGVDVVRQGDAGDAYYLVAEGRLQVHVRGRTDRVTLTRGDGFGEIALLRGTARTATVSVTEPARLWVLPRDAFLAAVTGSAAASLAQEQIDRALGRLRPDRWSG